ncbi:aminotransferase-like domain-containing protein [Agrobacterium vitis]|uniref:aminotransferase-like domain-containing protein n=1 Tax=Agrobacterium vitis TaxID=373 RepID=UPI001572F164|nr:PLP-dependent aminotransferase family protein [Agrobacterium vitis]NSZ17321.1 PLP-dependent aminotransferase family protein [Agrobacterium vitis]QZO03030.1 PLP-dependent aminotransferase family protein [Agrobacterium vitis]UJL88152.1 PLP-dependent aminotransferase family protein [Agrobacterium vitis]
MVSNLDAQGTSRIETVMAAIRARISSRSLATGARLPSVRGFAKTMQVSVSTVVEAYERLAAEGLIRSRPGSGFFVAAPLAPLSLTNLGPRLEREIDPFWVSRQSLDAGGDLLKPGCGWLPPDWLPQAALRRAIRMLGRTDGAVLTDYGSPLGLPGLRQLLSRRMADHGLTVAADAIMLTESGTHAIDLVCRFFLEPGDCVLVDDPCYFNFHALLRAHRANIVSVPYLADGPDLEAFAAIVEAHRPRLYITNSGVHNPTGASLSAVNAHRLLTLADRADLTIVEDDIFADFEDVASARLSAFDGLNRVVQIGSFSKTLSASVRCGYIAARPDWIEGLTDLKIATSFGGGRLSAELVLAVLTDGGYRKHLEGLKTRLAGARSSVAAELLSLGFTPWLQPKAGLFLWCRMPDGIESGALARHCLDDGVILAPGNVFSLSQNAGRFMRFNVAQTMDARVLGSLKAGLQQFR